MKLAIGMSMTILVNDDLDETEERLKTIITAGKITLSQQPFMATQLGH